MTETLYTDTENVLDSLAEAASNYDEGKLLVYDAGDARVVCETKGAVENRNLLDTEFDRVDDQVCRIDFTATLLELSFHESEVDSTLEFRPAGPDAIFPTQATSPVSLGPRLTEALGPMAQEGAIFTFAEVSATSMATGGYYTGFEYEYSIDGLQL
jgi:hypothetical protein